MKKTQLETSIRALHKLMSHPIKQKTKMFGKGIGGKVVVGNGWFVICENDKGSPNQR